ncbi:universal stress protein [Ferrimonas sediminicola]|uniref:Universal stress protein n=1 Tax=Ferrimonas sediminicola TaxID=2569538 RepID=A0A4U1BGQ0_9GAMM|nr:universal stress protein [Ferrimonas sediminicola]TKB50518.1 universal stress protein [Ferrimonas sediminicola]
MYRTTLLLGALQGDVGLLRSKIRALSRSLVSPCRVIVHGESPPLQRFYLFDDDELAATAESYKASVVRWAQSLVAPLTSDRLAFTLEYVWTKNLSAERHRWESDGELLIVYCAGKRIPSPFRHVVEESQCPVLLLSDRPWHTPPLLLAGIDPFHKSDRPANMDIKIVNQALALSRALKGEITLVHSCYVPAYMVKYRSMIQSTHQQGVQEFITANGWRKLDWRLIQGEPTQALVHYCQSHRTDILVVGLVARGVWQRQITGSTSDGLLEILCCDLLMVPKEAQPSG